MTPREASGRFESPPSGSGPRRRSPCRSSARRKSTARSGRLTEALELSNRADDLTELVPLGATYNAVVRFFVLMHLDRPAEADECCRTARSAARRTGRGHQPDLAPAPARDQAPRPRQTRGRIPDLPEGRTARRAAGIGEPCVVPWAGRAVIAHARAGHDHAAARVLAWLDSSAERLPCRYPRVAAAFGRAELAMRHADHHASEGHFRDALALHDDAELPMERMSTLLAYGDLLRQSGRPAQARRILAEALETAEATGTPALARYAREAFVLDRRHGGAGGLPTATSPPRS